MVKDLFSLTIDTFFPIHQKTWTTNLIIFLNEEKNSQLDENLSIYIEMEINISAILNPPFASWR